MDEFQTEENANYNETMTIYDVLCNSKKYCHPAHEWVHIGSLSTVRGGNLANDSNFFKDAGKKFDGKTAELAKACERLHGIRLEKAMWLTSWNCFRFFPLY